MNDFFVKHIYSCCSSKHNKDAAGNRGRGWSPAIRARSDNCEDRSSRVCCRRRQENSPPISQLFCPAAWRPNRLGPALAGNGMLIKWRYDSFRHCGIRLARRQASDARFWQAQRCCVTALSRRDLSRARESAREFAVEHAFASTEELCASPHVDAVFVTTPDALHLSDVLQAIRHGKPVLCEKPMARNAHEAHAMVKAARDMGLMLGVAQVMRFEQSVQYIRNQVRGWRDLGSRRWRVPTFSLRCWAAHAAGLTMLRWRPVVRWPMSACIASTRCASCWAKRWSPYRHGRTMTGTGW